jgi:hypothetical protein
MANKPPLGIWYWRQDFGNPPTHCEVFRYEGTDSINGVFYFRSVKEKSLMGRSFYQLNMNGFQPFLLNFATIERHRN